MGGALSLFSPKKSVALAAQLCYTECIYAGRRWGAPLKYRRLFAAALAALFLFGGCNGDSSQRESHPAGSYRRPPLAETVFDGSDAVSGGGAEIDLTNLADGYVAVRARHSARLKFQVLKGEETYNYDLANDGTPCFYPLQMGDGEYTFRVMRNTTGDRYAQLLSTARQVRLASEFAPFLRPSVQVDYTPQSACVAKAAQLSAEDTSQIGVVNSIYDYIVKNIRYDVEKAETVPKGYTPDPDETLESGAGICYDYAALAAAMLRSQGIPTKLVTGYVAPNDLYHAWNLIYLEESGWIAVEFQVEAGNWVRIDTTFAAGGADLKNFVGDGKNYVDRYVY